MTETTHSDPHIPFGTGAIVAETFSILFKKLHIIVLLGFIPALIELILTTSPFLQQSAQAAPTGEIDFTAIGAIFAVTFLITLVAVALTTAMVVQLAYDAKLGRPAQIGSYFGAALGNLPAIAVLSIVVGICNMIGMLLLIVPGIWLYGVFAVVTPAIVIDGAGFGAMRRSAELTRGYRWPIIGTLLLVFLSIFLISFVLAFVAAFATGGFATTPATGFGPQAIIQVVINAFAYGMGGVAVAMIFARLKEIKEGVSVSDLVDVFK